MHSVIEQTTKNGEMVHGYTVWPGQAVIHWSATIDMDGNVKLVPGHNFVERTARAVESQISRHIRKGY